MILFVQPIFVPDNIRLEQNEKSIVSIGNYIKKYPCEITFVFGGWAYNNNLWESIKNIINENIPKKNLKEIRRFDRNYGKAYVVNSLYKNNTNFNYLLTCDSDIIFSLECPNMFQRLEDIAKQSQQHTGKKFGFISLDQREGCCHIHSLFNRKYYIKNRYSENEMVSYPHNARGIAGGCLFISKELWDRVNGYNILGVYAGEDGGFLLDTHKAGYSYQVSNDVFIIHPHQIDKEYAETKLHIIHNKNLNHPNNKDPKLHKKAMDFMDNYWKNKNKNK